MRTGIATDTVALVAASLLVFMVATMGAGSGGRPGFIPLVALAWLLAAVLSTAIGLLQYFGVAHYLEPWVSAPPTGEAFANLRQQIGRAHV